MQLAHAVPLDRLAAEGEWDALFALEVPELLAGKAAEMPRTAAAVLVLVQQRAHELARDIADADRIEREIEARARELAEGRAGESSERGRALPVVEQRSVEERELPAAPTQLALPPGIPHESLARQWPSRGGRDWRRWPRDY